MIALVGLLLAGVITVQADCGHCPTENIQKREELLQAQAYNAMPKIGHPVTVQPGKAYVRVSHGYGPWVCHTPCKYRYDFSGYSVCEFQITTHLGGGVSITQSPKGYCAKTYHDDKTRPCQSIPQWDEDYGMWCYTFYSGSVWNWSYTHFPICVSTQTMCVIHKPHN